jgi:hypothetical protein
VKYNLVSKTTNEVVHTVDLAGGVGISGARTYFIGTKWWIEEKAITDEELKLL